MNETTVLHNIMLAVGTTPGVRIFRNNTGMGWQGKSKRIPAGVLIVEPRPLHAGLCPGSSDLIGWQEVTITPDMVGTKIARFVAIEVKTNTGRVSPDQVNFIRAVREAGGIAEVCRTADEARDLFL